MDIRGRLARNVKRLRKERGWSQEKLAAQAGVHRTYISGIERRMRNASIMAIERLMKALAVKAGQLLD